MTTNTDCCTDTQTHTYMACITVHGGGGGHTVGFLTPRTSPVVMQLEVLQ